MSTCLHFLKGDDGNVLASITEERDVFFRGHGKRVAAIASFFAQRLSLPQKSLELLKVAGNAMPEICDEVRDLMKSSVGAF